MAKAWLDKKKNDLHKRQFVILVLGKLQSLELI
jgi:hypothetical protein